MNYEYDVKFSFDKDLGELEANKKYSVSDLVEYIETLLARNEKLEAEVEHLEDEKNSLEQNIEENYKPISKAEQYDMGECNFH